MEIAQGELFGEGSEIEALDEVDGRRSVEIAWGS